MRTERGWHPNVQRTLGAIMLDVTEPVDLRFAPRPIPQVVKQGRGWPRYTPSRRPWLVPLRSRLGRTPRWPRRWRGREDLHPGPLPLPSQLAAGQGQDDACRARVRAQRGGGLHEAYMAAYDVHRAKVFARCEDTTGIVPFGSLVEQVMTAEPCASAERVFWVVDNGSSHRGQASIRPSRRRMADPQAHPPAHPRLVAQLARWRSTSQSYSGKWSTPTTFSTPPPSPLG